VASGETACAFRGPHSDKGFLRTDLSLNAVDIIHLYGPRFNIEHSFK
jgi:hypothetical protein